MTEVRSASEIIDVSLGKKLKDFCFHNQTFCLLDSPFSMIFAIAFPKT